MSDTKSPESEGIFSLQNACVSNGIANNNFSPPSEFSSEDGLLIGHEDGNSYMIMAEDSIKMKFGKGSITTVFDATGIKTDGDIKWSGGAHSSSTHVHNVMGPINTGVPIG
jgi:hypothetical protein